MFAEPVAAVGDAAVQEVARRKMIETPRIRIWIKSREVERSVIAVNVKETETGLRGRTGVTVGAVGSGSEETVIATGAKEIEVIEGDARAALEVQLLLTNGLPRDPREIEARVKVLLNKFIVFISRVSSPELQITKFFSFNYLYH